MVRIDRHLVALRYKLFLGLFLAVTILLLGYVTVAHAQDATTPDAACRLCHGDQAETLPLPSGESLPLGVDLATLDQSVHGVQSTDKLYCTDCHQTKGSIDSATGCDRWRIVGWPSPAAHRDRSNSPVPAPGWQPPLRAWPPLADRHSLCGSFHRSPPARLS